jgi:hypothetical protein
MCLLTVRTGTRRRPAATAVADVIQLGKVQKVLILGLDGAVAASASHRLESARLLRRAPIADTGISRHFFAAALTCRAAGQKRRPKIVGRIAASPPCNGYGGR